ncbi:MAG: 50S ribosomal protein L13 [Nanoarchaeota archaeon]
MVIDATNLILGRLASFAAKKALEGENIAIVNSEKAIISGKKEIVIKKYRERVKRGDPLKGPYFPTMPDRMLRRAIRGMLPFKNDRGRKAFKRVMCYLGVPDEYKNQKLETFNNISISRLKIPHFITLEDLSKQLRNKK